MGRKRNQGRARRAAKAKARQEEAEERENNNNDQMTAKEQVIEAEMQLMQSGNKCFHGHGFDPFSSGDTTSHFVLAILESFEGARNSNNSLQSDYLIAVRRATMTEFAEVWNDPAKMEMAISRFLSMGTELFLEGDYDNARRAASIARYLEQCIAVYLHQTQALHNIPKLVETYDADMHTLVKFFRHRIPCSCLHEKYEEVKNITKIGYCNNSNCNISDGRVERSKAMYCSRCRCRTYCSRECQIVDWHKHKPECDRNAEIIAEFDAMQQNTLSR